MQTSRLVVGLHPFAPQTMADASGTQTLVVRCLRALRADRARPRRRSPVAGVCRFRLVDRLSPDQPASLARFQLGQGQSHSLDCPSGPSNFCALAETDVGGFGSRVIERLPARPPQRVRTA